MTQIHANNQVTATALSGICNTPTQLTNTANTVLPNQNSIYNVGNICLIMILKQLNDPIQTNEWMSGLALLQLPVDQGGSPQVNNTLQILVSALLQAAKQAAVNALSFKFTPSSTWSVNLVQTGVNALQIEVTGPVVLPP